ncbi:Pachytene checkpoint protein 2 [Geranomyces variabilis]|nr:Pachytene checkpoint protein 2 [Geranomyces variabilis]
MLGDSLLHKRPPPVLHVEACLLTASTARYDHARKHVDCFLREHRPAVVLHTCVSRDELADVPFLRENLEFIQICEIRGAADGSDVHCLDDNTVLSIHVFQLNEEEGVDQVGDDEQDVVASNHWLLPARGLQGAWDSLIYEDNVQLKLLDYVYTSMLFGDRGVDPNLVAVNRVALLHGPPGTGKTSLCRALAQKLAIRLADRYSYGKLVEINSHSLFSKFFSESGKLVMRMFQQIHQLLDDQDVFVCVLIDEVESLSAARKAAMSGMEPSDSIRVVNALLTQLDQLRRKPNVLVLTTSNITEAIDVAFIDRADIKQYIGPPTHRARYAILATCLNELVSKGVISKPASLIDYREIEIWTSAEDSDAGLGGSTLNHLPAMCTDEADAKTAVRRHEESLLLWKVAGDCEGFSGRTLRKIPFFAHAFHLGMAVDAPSLLEYVIAMHRAVSREREDKGLLGKAGSTMSGA